MANGKPSGAKPKKRQFNADNRRQQREQTEVTIGGQKFHPTRNTTALRAELRRLSQENSDSIEELIKLTGRDYEEDTDANREEDTKRIEELNVRIEEILFEQIKARLVGDGDTPPPVEFLQENFDPADADDFFEFLAASPDAPDPS